MLNPEKSRIAHVATTTAIVNTTTLTLWGKQHMEQQESNSKQCQ